MLRAACNVASNAAFGVGGGHGGVEEFARTVHNNLHALGFPVDVLWVAFLGEYLYGKSIYGEVQPLAVDHLYGALPPRTSVKECVQRAIGGVGGHVVDQIFEAGSHLAPHVYHRTIEVAGYQMIP